MKDVGRDYASYKELYAGGGRGTVPCLRIEKSQDQVEWLYESLDIIRYLDQVVLP